MQFNSDKLSKLFNWVLFMVKSSGGINIKIEEKLIVPQPLVGTIPLSPYKYHPVVLRLFHHIKCLQSHSTIEECYNSIPINIIITVICDWLTNAFSQNRELLLDERNSWYRDCAASVSAFSKSRVIARQTNSWYRDCAASSSASSFDVCKSYVCKSSDWGGDGTGRSATF